MNNLVAILQSPGNFEIPYPLMLQSLEALLDPFPLAIVRNQPATLDRHNAFHLQYPIGFLHRFLQSTFVDQEHFVVLDGPSFRVVKVHLNIQCVGIGLAITTAFRVTDFVYQIL